MTEHIYKDPKKYSKNNALQYNFAMKILCKISFEERARVLDIGCGDGVITKEIAAIVNEGCVIGTDISAQMIEFASKQYANQSNLRFLIMDASKNIFREQFDVVTSFNCLHWVKNQRDALAGIEKAVIPGGQIALLLSHKKSLYHFVLDSVCSSKKWKKYFIDFVSPRSFFDVASYKEMILELGLQIIDLSEEEMTHIYHSKEQLKDFFSAAGSQIKSIPEEKKQEFLNDFVAEYLKQVKCESEEIIPVSFWCLHVLALKPKVELIEEREMLYQPRLFSKL